MHRSVACLLAFSLLTTTLGGGLTGCASARMSDHESDNLFRAGNYVGAAERLKKGLEEQGDNGRDVLLYLLDIGLSLHSAGQFAESNKYFLKADKIAEIKDYTSIAKESATLLTSDNIKDYQGEDFEKVLINTYLSMNYAALGNYEDALVEARRVNQKLYRMVNEGQRKYKQSAFARYLSAMLYEAEGNINDAYVDYKETLKLNPSVPQLGRDLWRMAKLSGNREDMEKWDAQFKLGANEHEQALGALARSGKGEIIVIYENGISPLKHPDPAFTELPKFFPRPNPVAGAHVDLISNTLAGGPKPASAVVPGIPGVLAADTVVLDNIETTAIENLNEKYSLLLAKKLAGIVAKEVVSDQIGKHTDPALGLLAKLFFYVSDQADVRSWNLLPHDLQIARLAVDPGAYAVRVTPVGSGRVLPEKTVHVGAGKKVFIAFRYMP